MAGKKGINLFKLVRGTIDKTKEIGRSFVPPKAVPKPGTYPINPHLNKKALDAHEAAKLARENAFSRQILAGGAAATAIGAGTVLARRKPEEQATPVTRTTSAPAAKPVAPRKRLVEYQPKSEVENSSSSRSKNTSRGKNDSRRNRRSDSRLGAFSQRKRSSASPAVAKDSDPFKTPRATIQPEQVSNAGVDFANKLITNPLFATPKAGRETIAKAPKVREVINQGATTSVPNVEKLKKSADVKPRKNTMSRMVDDLSSSTRGNPISFQEPTLSIRDVSSNAFDRFRKFAYKQLKKNEDKRKSIYGG